MAVAFSDQRRAWIALTSTRNEEGTVEIDRAFCSSGD